MSGNMKLVSKHPTPKMVEAALGHRSAASIWERMFEAAHDHSVSGNPELLRHHPDVKEVLKEFAEACIRWVDNEKSGEHFEETVAKLLRTVSTLAFPGRQAEVDRLQTLALTRLGAFERVRAQLDQAQAMAVDLDRTAVAAYLAGVVAGHRRPGEPARVFTRRAEEHALEWLEQYREGGERA